MIVGSIGISVEDNQDPHPFLPQEIYDRIHTVYRIAGGRAFTRSEPTERVMIMITWADVFAFVTMLVTILLYIETHRKHKK